MSRPADSWRLLNSELDLAAGAIMGVVNVTPDSFSDGGLHQDPEAAVAHGLRLVGQGAAVIDVGGESTRPGSTGVSPSEEIARVVPVVSGLSSRGVTVSIDTSKPEVASAALDAGAQVVNDVTGLRHEGMAELIGDAGCGAIVMHMKGNPRDMQNDPTYQDVVAEVEEYLIARAATLQDSGLGPGRVAIDPGIGFGKTLEHNLSLIRNLSRLASHGYPVVLGASRKRFLGTLTSLEDPAARDGATAVTTALGFVHGARVFRVHDVEASRHALQIASAIVTAH